MGMSPVLLTAGNRPATLHPTIMPYNIAERARTERLAVIRRELVERIRPVCGGLPQDLFLELVESMAAIQLKYELRTSPETRKAG
jgi:hypothetical protein